MPGGISAGYEAVASVVSQRHESGAELCNQQRYQIGSKRVPLIWGTVNLLKSWGE